MNVSKPARYRGGFTLIELLIVVAIIAILAAIAVPNFLEAQTRSKVSRVKNDTRALSTAIEAYHVDHNEYPPSSAEPSGGDLGDSWAYTIVLSTQLRTSPRVCMRTRSATRPSIRLVENRFTTT